VAIVVIFGIFMSVLDSTIVNIAVTHLQSVFGASLDSVQWVLTGYTLAQGVATPLTAYFSDRFGLKRFYIVSLAAFTVGSALCGLAWNLPVLIFFRILQGAGGAFLTPLSITLLYSVFAPHERGTAMGFLGLPILLAPALGPTVGGYIVTFIDWRFIFYINVPIGILGILLGTLFLQEVRSEGRTSFDVPGFLFSAIGLGTLLYGLSDASTDGWGSTKVLGFLTVGIVLLAFFIIIEINVARSGRKPLLNVGVFKNVSFSTSSFASTLVTISLYGGLFLVPIYLQSLRGLSAYQAGVVMLPQSFASMVAVLIGGRLVDRFGVRAVVIPGLILMAVANWLFSTITVDLPYSSFQLILVLRGFSTGLCMQPLMVSALADIKPRQLSQASSMSTVLRFVASSLGVAVLSTLVQNQTKVHYVHLAESVTALSPLGQFITRLQAAFMASGASLSAARSAAIQEIYGLVQRQAYILGMQDTFKIVLLLSIVAIVASFFVRGPSASQSGDNLEEDAEAAAAREEAMIAG
jgi:DHA2 family multidrug resistance protein